MKKSFTLIELIVVIAIIAILAGIIAPNAYKSLEKAKISQVIADLKSVKSATLAHYADTGIFPYGHIGGNNIWTKGCWSAGACSVGPWFIDPAAIQGWDGPYLTKWPGKSPWGIDYTYLMFSETVSWMLCDATEASNEMRVKIDEKIDDGNLATGDFTLQWGAFIAYDMNNE